MRLKILNGDRQGQIIPLSASVFVGRAEGNHIVLADQKVSRQHAQIWEYEGRWWLKVLQPTNPVYVNQVAHSSTFPLKSGMIVQIGDTLLEFEGEAAGPRVGVNQNAPTVLTSSGAARRRSSPILTILLGVGAAGLILALIFFLAQPGGNGNDAEAGGGIANNGTPAATEGGAVIEGSPTATETPAATLTPSMTPTPTATLTPSTTPTPLAIVVSRNEPVSEPYTPELLAPAQLDEKLVPADKRDLLVTLTYQLTNTSSTEINLAPDAGQVILGVFITEEGSTERKQIPSFWVPNDNRILAPLESRIVTWQVVIGNTDRLAALALQYNGVSMETVFFDAATPTPNPVFLATPDPVTDTAPITSTNPTTPTTPTITLPEFPPISVPQ